MDDSDNFLDMYIDYTKETESPPDFHLWCGIYIASIALGRKCLIDMNAFQVYPNFYILLLARSGEKKSIPVILAKKFLNSQEPRPNLIAQKLTPEALIDAMRIQEVNDKATIYREKHEGHVVVDEMVLFLNRSTYDNGLAGLMLNFFDADEFEYKTKGGGSQKLNDIFFSVLAATTPEQIPDIIPEKAIGGGLTSRFLIVTTQQRQPRVPVPKLLKITDKLKRAYDRLSMLNGIFTFEKKALDHYTEAYMNWGNHPFSRDPTLSGYANRKFTHLFKVAMVVTACRTYDTKISYADYLRAEEVVNGLEANLPFIMNVITSTPQGQVMSQVMRLIEAGVKSKKELVKFMSNKITVHELDTLLDTLEQGGRIRRDYSGGDCLIYPVHP